MRIAFNADLLGLVVHAVDGTKIMACSSRRTMWHKKDLEKLLQKLDESISDAMRQVERAQRKEVGEFRLPESLQDHEERKRFIQEAMRKLEQEDAKHMHPGEPDARVMKAGRCNELSFNAQAVADQKTGMVVAADVVNDENDSAQLVPMLDQVKDNLGETAKESVADGGYASAAQIDSAEKAKYSILTNPGPTRDRRKNPSILRDSSMITIMTGVSVLKATFCLLPERNEADVTRMSCGFIVVEIIGNALVDPNALRASEAGR